MIFKNRNNLFCYNYLLLLLLSPSSPSSLLLSPLFLLLPFFLSLLLLLLSLLSFLLIFFSIVIIVTIFVCVCGMYVSLHLFYSSPCFSACFQKLHYLILVTYILYSQCSYKHHFLSYIIFSSSFLFHFYQLYQSLDENSAN